MFDFFKKLKKKATSTAVKNEIMILYRRPGEFKLRLPPLSYSGKAAYSLQENLASAVGVEEIKIDESAATVCVSFDPASTTEKKLFLLIDQLIRPLLAKASDSDYQQVAQTQKWAKIKRLTFSAGVLLSLGYLAYIHARLFLRWIFNPFRYWAPLAVVGFLIYSHRKVVARGLGMAPAAA